MDTPILISVVLVVGISFGLFCGYMLGFSRGRRAAEAVRSDDGSHRLVFAWLLIGSGCVALVFAVATGFHAWRFTRLAQRASGEIIEMRHGRDDLSQTTAPTFRFQDAGGKEYTIESGSYSSPPEFDVGDHVVVLYPPNAPKSARIDTYWQVWGTPTLLGIIGIDLPIGLVVLFWPKIIGRWRKLSGCGREAPGPSL